MTRITTARPARRPWDVLARRRALMERDHAERMAYLERLTALNEAGALTDQELSDARRALTSR